VAVITSARLLRAPCAHAPHVNPVRWSATRTWLASAETSPQLERSRREGSLLAADDLRDALVADSQYAGDFSHRQAVAVGGADRLVALGAELLLGALEGGLLLCVVAGEGGELGAGVGGFAGLTGDRRIVRSIPASRLA
jgi:hypothetical protein